MTDQIVQMTLGIINHLQPGQWFIENPNTGLLKGQPFIRDYAFAYVDVDYCQFISWGNQKPTRIWGPVYLNSFYVQGMPPKNCTSIIFRSSGNSGHRRVLGTTPPRTERPGYPWNISTATRRDWFTLLWVGPDWIKIGLNPQ
jgi:hypothetical protein